ncbi:unnamed protein product [Brachionus calyciflorus]|uniref:Large ribosomal subunit protein eL22 n=1 Tax=Brachionus calyciflorus TaxID=104777 RepID=A0A813LYM7_9BILA|nr:unnamed protein product [Brachionus calyciflorus]
MAPKVEAKQQPKVKKVQKSQKKKKLNLRFTIDCTHPVEDGILDMVSFERFLLERIKINGKTGQLANQVNVERTKQKLVVTSEIAFSKRYLKYLTKKFLKKNKLRDWLRVIANAKDQYELRYFNIDQDEEAEEETQ